MTSDTCVFAQSLSSMERTFRKAADAGVPMEVDAESVRNLADILAVMKLTFSNIEQELEILRLSEAVRKGRTAIDKLATEQLHELVEDPQGKVIRPDFGGRS